MNQSIFSPEALAKRVHATLDEATAAIPEGRHHAVILDATVQDGQPEVRALYVQRTAGGWDVSLEGAWSGRGHVSGKVALLKSW